MFDERFARQYRYEPPSEFPLTSPYTGIVHHLSGPKNNALTQTFHQWIMVGRCCTEVGTIYFHFACWFLHHHTRVSLRLLGSCFKTSR